MSSAIGIIGCGWLGLPLAKSFLEEGYTVHGTTTSKEKLATLKGAGIAPFLISLTENGIEGPINGFLIGVDTLIINVPPKLRGGNKENYIKKMQLLYNAIKASDTKNIVFVSSTSVYGNTKSEATEETIPEPQTESGKQLLASENLFKEDTGLQTTIVRFGGLIGPNRHPVNYLAGKKELSNGNHPVNLIHLEDCIRIIKAIVGNGYWNDIFNGVYPHHPTKKEYYTLEAQKRGLPIPEYAENDKLGGTKITSSRLIEGKKFRFSTSIIN